jgi:hypothetical protein
MKGMLPDTDRRVRPDARKSLLFRHICRHPGHDVGEPECRCVALSQFNGSLVDVDGPDDCAGLVTSERDGDGPISATQVQQMPGRHFPEVMEEYRGARIELPS